MKGWKSTWTIKASKLHLVRLVRKCPNIPATCSNAYYLYLLPTGKPKVCYFELLACSLPMKGFLSLGSLEIPNHQQVISPCQFNDGFSGRRCLPRWWAHKKQNPCGYYQWHLDTCQLKMHQQLQLIEGGDLFPGCLCNYFMFVPTMNNNDLLTVKKRTNDLKKTPASTQIHWVHLFCLLFWLQLEFWERRSICSLAAWALFSFQVHAGRFRFSLNAFVT